MVAASPASDGEIGHDKSDRHGLALNKPITGIAGARLVDMVVTPHALVEAGGKLRLHTVYYITKQIIPALERVLNLVGADPRSWFVGMTKPQRLLPQKRPPTALPLTDLAKPGGGIGTIDQYYLSRHCAVGSHLFTQSCMRLVVYKASPKI